MATTWRIGENVPWSVSWTGEFRFRLSRSIEFPGYTDLIQADNPGQGTPKFAAIHANRNRAGMRDQLCHVCGRRTLARDRYIFPVHSGNFVTIGDGSSRYAGNVPPVHLACARRAAAQCPHLSHGNAQPVAYPSEASILVPRPDVPEGMEEIAKNFPKHVKIVFAPLRIYGPRFSRTIEKLRGPPAAKQGKAVPF